MARRRQVDGEKYIEADNGFGWTRQRASVASIESGRYEITVFGITYKLEKWDGPNGDIGWYLYNTTNGLRFFGEWCARTLLPAVDEASKLIAKADLRGEGYERPDNCTGCPAPAQTRCRICRRSLCRDCLTDHHHEGYGTPADDRP